MKDTNVDMVSFGKPQGVAEARQPLQDPDHPHQLLLRAVSEDELRAAIMDAAGRRLSERFLNEALKLQLMYSLITNLLYLRMGPWAALCEVRKREAALPK